MINCLFIIFQFSLLLKVGLNNNKKIALITGATSGIGEATAILLSNYCSLIICGRRKDKLQKLEKSLSKKTNILSLCFDVRDKRVIKDKIQGLTNDWKCIDILVNNAGNAHGFDLIHEGNLEDWDAMIDINVKGLLYVTKSVVPLMVKRKSGIIINIGSIAGKEVYTKGNVYCASKFAVDAISKGMRLDLNNFNIKVTSINPGLVETEFSMVRFKNNIDKARNVYKGIQPLKANDVAEIIDFIIKRPDNICISDISILPKSQASSTVVKRSD